MNKILYPFIPTLLIATWFGVAPGPMTVADADNSTPPPSDREPTAQQPADSAGCQQSGCCQTGQNRPPVDPALEQKQPVEPIQPADLSLPTTKARTSVWIASADREPFDLDFKMTNQDNQPLVLSNLVGRPVALSFVFTRCPNPNLCPMITLTMASLQRDLEAAGLAPHVNLALLTYDPVYDTPERLKRYAQDHGLKLTHAMMLRPDADRFGELLGELQIGADYRPDGSIGHFIELLLIDHQGRFVRDYQGSVWDNAAVLSDLKRLVAEQQAAHNGGIVPIMPAVAGHDGK